MKVEAVRSAGSKGKATPPPTSYHKLSLEVIRSLTGHSAHPHSRPDSRSAADAGRSPLAASAEGKVSPLQPSERQQPPIAATASKGRVSPSQPLEGQALEGAAKGEGSPAEPFVSSPKGSRSPLQSANGQHKAVAGPSPGSQPKPTGMARKMKGNAAMPGKPDTCSRDVAEMKTGTQARRSRAGKVKPSSAAQRIIAGKVEPGSAAQHSMAGKVKTAVIGQPKSADSTASAAAGSTVATTAAANKVKSGSSAAGRGVVGSKTSLHGAADFASAQSSDNAQLTELTPRKRQTTFKFEDIAEQLGNTGVKQPVVLQSQGTFTQKIMQQMSYTGSHKDQARLFLEMHLPLHMCANIVSILHV